MEDLQAGAKTKGKLTWDSAGSGKQTIKIKTETYSKITYLFSSLVNHQADKQAEEQHLLKRPLQKQPQQQLTYLHY